MLDISEEQARLNYFARKLYILPLKKADIFQNAFRNSKGELKSRSKTFKVNDIYDAIRFKTCFDKLILMEIDYINNLHGRISNSTYSCSFRFNTKFISNIELHWFSKNGCHQAIVGSLSSYTQMNFECFDKLTLANIKSYISDKKVFDQNSQDHMAQMIALFLCETSRNPASFFTIPMCLKIFHKINALIEWSYAHNDLSFDPTLSDQLKNELLNIISYTKKYVDTTKFTSQAGINYEYINKYLTDIFKEIHHKHSLHQLKLRIYKRSLTHITKSANC